MKLLLIQLPFIESFNSHMEDIIKKESTKVSFRLMKTCLTSPIFSKRESVITTDQKKRYRQKHSLDWFLIITTKRKE